MKADIMIAPRVRFVGRNKDVKSLMKDLVGNDEKVSELEMKFRDNPILSSMVRELYNVDVLVS